jgi:hypothetical protein
MTQRTLFSIVLLITFSLVWGDVVVAPEQSQPEPIPSKVNLYNVDVGSHAEAEVLRATGSDAVMKTRVGYLVLASSEIVRQFVDFGLKYELIASGIDRSEIAMDMRIDKRNIGKYPLLFDEGGLRLFRVEPHHLELRDGSTGIVPLRSKSPPIIYSPPRDFKPSLKAPLVDLETLAYSARQDSLESYSYRLQAYNGRPAGSSSISACANWMASKFEDMGYDSIVIDVFMDSVYDEWAPVKNVIAYKIGTAYPDFHIIYGAHYDAVPGSPGADDNGSGTAGVLEIARALADIETNVTHVFALWDGEEEGLLGSYQYANRAYLEDERIVLNINMDMIAHYENTSTVKAYTANSDYLQLATYLTDSLEAINLTCHYYNGGGTDYIPFEDIGHDVIALHENIFSSVYHSYRDSTSYLNFDYMTRVVRTALVTGYMIDQNFIPDQDLIISSPGGLPQKLYPGLPTPVEIDINLYGGAAIVPGGVLLHYAVNDGAMIAEPMNDMGGDVYTAAFPALACADRVQYYITIDEDDMGTFYYPDSSLWAIACAATGLETIFDDNFESDMGWEASMDASNGEWMRARPSGGASGSPSTDYDGNRFVMLTDNSYGADVDNGTSILISPTIDAGHGTTLIQYARWYSNHTGNDPHNDMFYVYISNDDGTTWSMLEAVGPEEQASGGWYPHQFWVEDEIEPTDQVRLRFIVSDLGEDSQVEAAVDAVRVMQYTYAPLINTESLPNWTVGAPFYQQLFGLSCAGELTWSDKYGHLIGSGLSVSPTGAVEGTPLTEGLIIFAAEALDELGEGDERMYSFFINAALAIETENLPDALTGLPYSHQLTADGGTGSQTWTDTENVLNGTGLSLTSDGQLTGTPADTGTVNLTVRVEDEVGAFDEKGFVLTVKFDYDCGDANGDRQVNVADAVFIINYVFKDGPAPEPLMGGDANCDNEVNVGDAVYVINYVFKGGPEPCCP